jgi:hypothetical protein
MATYRNSSNSVYDIGSAPPQVNWTIVKGDTSSFQVYVTDDLEAPLVIADWTIKMEIKRPNTTPGVFTDNATIIVTLVPAPTDTDGVGEFTVALTKQQSAILLTGDIFDIELSKTGTVWTVARGIITLVEDVTN